MEMKKFYQLYKEGKIGRNKVNDYIEAWHTGKSEESMREYLGMSEMADQEYSDFIVKGSLEGVYGAETNTLKMRLLDNSTYEDCLTLNKIYDVEFEETEEGSVMYKLKDDNNEPLQTMINRFEVIV